MISKRQILLPFLYYEPPTPLPHYYFISLWYPLELGTFLISKDPPPNFELFPTETWDFFDFLTTPPPFPPYLD